MPLFLTALTSSVTFAENTVNAAPQRIDEEVIVTTLPSTAPNLLSVSGLRAEDRVSIVNQGTGPGQIGFNGTAVTFGGLAIGTATGGIGNTFTVIFPIPASAAAPPTPSWASTSASRT